MKNAFSVFVFGDYELYLPYYVYTIEVSYPDTDVVLFYNGELSKNVKSYLKSKEFVRFYENFFIEYSYFKKYQMFGSGGLTLLRYLIPDSYFEEYNKVYFGDVDVLILKDSLNLFEFHTKQIEKTGVPFSNRVRKLPEGGLSKRLTGLHFVDVKPYYKSVNPLINRVLEDKAFQEQFFSEVNRDEELLYALNMEAFNFNPINLSENKSPLHGFHIGVFRGNKEIHPNEIRDNSLLTYEEIQAQLKNLLGQKEFQFILKSFFLPQK